MKKIKQMIILAIVMYLVTWIVALFAHLGSFEALAGTWIYIGLVMLSCTLLYLFGKNDKK